jgi:hypothetical protein
MWLISSDRPAGFFALRGLVFFATVLCTFYNSYTFSNWRAISALCAVSLLLLTPTFEVIYTLDKGEIYIGCLFSLIVFTYLTTMKKILDRNCSERLRLFASILIFVCSMHAVLIKETGLLLAPFGLLLPIGSVLANSRSKPSGESKDSEQIIKKKLLQWSCLAGGLCVSTSLMCKICFIFLGPSTTAYGIFSPSPDAMLQQLKFFVLVIPDFFTLFALCLISSVVVLRRKYELSETHNLFFSNVLTLTAGAGATALLVWKAPIIYSWYPLFIFLLPASALYLRVITKREFRSRVIGLLSVTLLVGVIPVRTVQAQIQYDLDSCAQELVRNIARRTRENKKQESYTLPFPSPGGAELAEELKILTMGELVHNYIENAWTSKTLPVLFCNFFNYYFPPGTEPGVNSLSDDQVQKLGYSRSDNYVPEPGLVKFYLSNSVDGSSWIIDNLRVGDVLLIPFGDLPPSLATYRGAPLFCTDWKNNVAFSPQVEYKPVFVVKRRILRAGGHPYTIGWIGLAISSVPKISWSISTAGKLYDGAQIFAAKELEEHFIVLTAEMSRPMLIWQKCNGKELPVSVSPINDRLFKLRVLLPRSAKENSATCLRMQTFGLATMPTFLRLRSAHVE